MTFGIKEFLGEKTFAILIAALTAFLFWAASRFCKSWLIPRLCKLTDGPHLRALHILFDGFSKPFPVLIWLLGLCTALPMLPLGKLQAFLISISSSSIRISVLLCCGWGFWRATALCDFALNNISSHLDLKASATLSSILKKGYRVLVVAFVAVGVLDVLHYSVTGLITGFGLLGLTVSLAAQDSASNLFSGLMILLERPFSIGDWITVNGVDGAVEDLTFRSTKIRAMDNTLYVLPNSSVTSTTINNSTARNMRLFRFTLNLTFDSPRNNLEALMAHLTNLLKNNPAIDPSSVIVRLTGFSESGISILVNAYVLRKDLNEFLNIQNQLNLDILDAVRAQGLRFAMTASRVYMDADNDNQ